MSVLTDRLKSVILLTCTALVFLPAHCLATSYSYSISNGGAETAINILSGYETAAQYYNYYNSDGHPDFGTQADTAFLWLWEDKVNDIISLGFIFDTPNSGTAGHADLALSGVPSTGTWTVKDDPGDALYTLSRVRWNWNGSHTDGGMISGLNGEWTIDIGIYPEGYISGINNWYFVDDEQDKFAHPFDISEGLTINASPIPEPTTMLLLGSGLAGLAGFGRRMRNRKR